MALIPAFLLRLRSTEYGVAPPCFRNFVGQVIYLIVLSHPELFVHTAIFALIRLLCKYREYGAITQVFKPEEH